MKIIISTEKVPFSYFARDFQRCRMFVTAIWPFSQILLILEAKRWSDAPQNRDPHVSNKFGTFIVSFANDHHLLWDFRKSFAKILAVPSQQKHIFQISDFFCWAKKNRQIGLLLSPRWPLSQLPFKISISKILYKYVNRNLKMGFSKKEWYGGAPKGMEHKIVKHGCCWHLCGTSSARKYG